MNNADWPTASENPFCTRRVRPGAIPFVFPPGENPDALVDRLRQAGWRGEIVGEHGSGKSTLLAALTPAIERAGRRVVVVALHDGQRRPPPGVWSDAGLDRAAVLIVDGYEQLSRWSRLTLKRFCRRRGTGLVVTAHDSVGFPPLYRTVVTASLVERIVGQLTCGREGLLTSEEVSECMSRHGGNLRETLFDLYDICEQRRPSPGENMT